MDAESWLMIVVIGSYCGWLPSFLLRREPLFERWSSVLAVVALFLGVQALSTSPPTWGVGLSWSVGIIGFCWLMIRGAFWLHQRSRPS
jgi:hypothetical protein